MVSKTPKPPYYVVIFTSKLKENPIGYNEMSQKMNELVSQQDGYLGMDHAREEIGITTCYWKDLESIRKWRDNMDHTKAKALGIAKWYEFHNTRIARVEMEY